MVQSKNTFSMIVIPDTQDLCTRHPERLKKMTKWIVDHSEELNLKKIIHVGDIVNDGALREQQYLNHQKAFSLIDESGIPNIIAIGNHDYDNILNQNRDSDMFNKYCGVHKYEGKEWFGGTFERNKAENMYTRIVENGVKFLFLSLEFGPRDEVLEWANHVLANHSDYKAIVVTHSYLYLTGERTKPGDPHNPKNYQGAIGANDGEDIWHKCLKLHGNVLAVFSGHHIEDNVSYRKDKGIQGNTVHQFFQNWQCADNGGDGRLRILKMNTDKKELSISVFNPQTEKYETGDGYSLNLIY